MPGLVCCWIMIVTFILTQGGLISRLGKTRTVGHFEWSTPKQRWFQPTANAQPACCRIRSSRHIVFIGYFKLEPRRFHAAHFWCWIDYCRNCNSRDFDIFADSSRLGFRATIRWWRVDRRDRFKLKNAVWSIPILAETKWPLRHVWERSGVRVFWILQEHWSAFLKLCRLGDITLVFTGVTRSCDRYWVELAEILAARQRFRV